MRGEILTSESLITPPAQEPLDFALVKKHLKFASTSEDDLIAGWIAAARQYFEEYTGRQCVTATWEYWLDEFPACGRIELPHPPLQDVISVLYVDGNGDTQSFSTGASPDEPKYIVHAPSGDYAERGWIEPVAGQSWPGTRNQTAAVRIQFTAGYGDGPDDQPAIARAAMQFMVGLFHQFRSEVHEQRRGVLTRLPLGVDAILQSFKRTAGPRLVLRREGSRDQIGFDGWSSQWR